MSALPKCQIPKWLQPWAERSKAWIKTPCGWLGCALVAIFIVWAAKPVGKDWVDVLRALATPAIAYAGYSIARNGYVANLRHQNEARMEKKIRIYLFFIEKSSHIQIAMSKLLVGENQNPEEIKNINGLQFDIAKIYYEIELYFGKDEKNLVKEFIDQVNHSLSVHKNHPDGEAKFPSDDAIIKAFRKKIEAQL
jgi:hypothetical protein